jgi:dephospho-CoA kinase
MKILKIAVTGSAGSGKSLVCRRLKELGLVTLDCDQIARQIVEPGKPAYNKVKGLFGNGVVQKDLQLYRSKLRALILEKPLLRKKMEGILHPEILDELFLQIKTTEYKKEKAVAVEVPLLFELDMGIQFDVTITVAAKDSDLAVRISSRDGVSLENAQKILDLQMPQSEKIQRSDHVISNNGTTRELFDSVDELYARLKKNS